MCCNHHTVAWPPSADTPQCTSIKGLMVSSRWYLGFLQWQLRGDVACVLGASTVWMSMVFGMRAERGSEVSQGRFLVEGPI